MRLLSFIFRNKFLFCAAAGISLIVITLDICTTGARAAISDAKIHAVYKVEFRGFNLGDLKIWSDLSERKYKMFGELNIKVLKGYFFRWTGTSESNGALNSGHLIPAAFSFKYKTRRKSARLNMQFSKNSVSQIVAVPPNKPSPKQVPVEEKHMRGVVDPLSAVMSVSLRPKLVNSGEEACKTRIPIFDGKERYDLVFTHKKTIQLNDDQVKSYKGPAYVCRVKYVPIAGHKPDRKSHKFMVTTENIEMWLLPMPEAKLYVPYYIVVPTPVGYATLTSTVFQVDEPGIGRTAFVH